VFFHHPSRLDCFFYSPPPSPQSVLEKEKPSSLPPRLLLFLLVPGSASEITSFFRRVPFSTAFLGLSSTTELLGTMHLLVYHKGCGFFDFFFSNFTPLSFFTRQFSWFFCTYSSFSGTWDHPCITLETNDFLFPLFFSFSHFAPPLRFGCTPFSSSVEVYLGPICLFPLHWTEKGFFHTTYLIWEPLFSNIRTCTNRAFLAWKDCPPFFFLSLFLGAISLPLTFRSSSFSLLNPFSPSCSWTRPQFGRSFLFVSPFTRV